MGIYSLEIHLKVAICKRLNLRSLPRAFEIHDLEGLLVLTGLHAALGSAPKAVQENWSNVNTEASRINELRYSPSLQWSLVDATSFFSQLTGSPDGVLPWLSTHI